MKQKFLLVFFLIFSLAFAPQIVFSADPKLTIQDSAYSAKFVSQSVPDPIVLEVGQKKTVTFQFKNTGTATWNEKGSNYISAYTVEPKYRASSFRGSNWISTSQTGKISGTVKPGATGTLSLELKAPNTPGEFVEQFYLSSENKTWMQGGYFFVKIKVVPANGKVVAPEPAKEVSVKTPTSGYTTKFLGLSKSKVTLAPGERVSIMFMYQNAGAKVWESYSFKGNEQSALAGQSLSFADDSWKSSTLVKEGTVRVTKDGILQKNFTLKAPMQAGSYQAKFYLEVAGQKVEGSDATVDVTVTSNAPSHVEHAVPVAPLFSSRVLLPEEPKIRVGLLKVEKDVTFVAREDEYDVYQGSQLIDRIPVGGTATVSYTNGIYTCACNGKTFTSTEFFRFVPVANMRSVFELRNFSRTVPWQSGVNFSTYRGIFEFRFPKSGDLPYAINELFFEDYVAGIREVSNGTPMEYMKSQAILHRTYAYYIKEHTDKHADRFFDVVASTGDQLYLGYESEKLMPRFLEAVQFTRGLMVVYDVDKNPSTLSEVVITPYFGNTDGRTRSWTEVWGGKDDKPWLVSVPAIYDKRDKKSMYGHGVGMSQRDAMIKASEEKLDYGSLIRYYYTGVEIEKIY